MKTQAENNLSLQQIPNSTDPKQSIQAGHDEQSVPATSGEAITDTIDVNKISKEYPLRKIHYLWLWIHAIISPYYTSQRFALYMLFIQTSAGCDFKHDLAGMYMISIFCETLVIPITGYVCDHFKRFNHIILVITMIINLILSIIVYAIFIFKWSHSEQLIIIITISQTLISMQFNNSLYKLTKLYIDYDTSFTDCLMVGLMDDTNIKDEKYSKCNQIQMSYFTRIGIWGRLAQQTIIALFVIPIFFIMKNQSWTFQHVQYFICIFVIISGFITLLFSIKIFMIFHENPKIFAIKNENESLIQSVNEIANGSDGLNTDIDSKGIKSLYFCKSFKLLFIDNKMTRYGIINIILVFLLADLLASYEPLTIAGVDTDKNNKTLSNFCGNYLTNLMYQTIFSSVFTGIGAILYIYVLLPFVDTFHFYRYVYPISSIFMGGAIFIISGFEHGIDQTWLSLSLGFLLAFYTYAHQFDDYLNLAYMNKEAVGFYQIVYAWSNNVWKIFGYLFIYLNILNIAVAIMIGVLLISSVIQSLYFSKLFVPK